MKTYIFNFICKLEGYGTAIRSLHWDAKSLSQHQLCDDIASAISDFQDKVAEVEQSISGKLPVNKLKTSEYKVTTLKKFVEDVISSTNSFYKKLQKEGDEYIGMRSDTEAFLSDIQRQLYLVDFTVKEDLKRQLRSQINENNKVTVSNGKQSYKLTENELREMVKQAVSNIKENKTKKEKIIEVSQNDIRRMVTESLKHIVKESVWYGETQPFEEILKAANIIRRKYEYVNDENYEPWDDSDGRDLSYDIYKWAERVENEAEDWIRYNSSNSSINGGENW